MALVLSSARRLGLSQEVAHDAVQLLDRLGAEAADSSPSPLAALLLLASRQGAARSAVRKADCDRARARARPVCWSHVCQAVHCGTTC